MQPKECYNVVCSCATLQHVACHIVDSFGRACIQTTNVLTSVTEVVTSAELAYVEEEMQKTYMRPKNIKSKFLRRLRKKLACMQKILVLFQQLKSSLLNIRSILLSEPQLTAGRRSAMMVTELLLRGLEDPTC